MNTLPPPETTQAPAPPPAAPPAAAAQAPWRRTQPFDPEHKSPRLAAFLSLVPGLGQVYVGYYVRGFATAATVLFLILMAGTVAPAEIAPVFGFAAFFTMLYNIVDAGRLAAMYNHVATGLDRIEMPDSLGLPKLGGSIAGGVVLLVLSLIALSHTALGMSLEWLENWWPVFPLALGAYLLVRGLQERQEAGTPRAAFDGESGEA